MNTERKVVLYIAMSLDGYIADTQGSIGFLSRVETPDEDYGYREFVTSVDTLIWGRKTYDTLLSFGIDFPYPDKKCYVWSQSRTGQDANVTYYNGHLVDLINELKQSPGEDIYCDGGAELVTELLRYQLIDRLIISVVPHLVGSGTRLFKEGRPEQNIQLTHSKVYPSGLVQLCYEAVRSSMD
ncbi:MAG: dihydrofolate reductase family protein [Spirosomataceae bacterium]